MVTSWYEKVREYKSPDHVISAFLLRSRDIQRAKVEELTDQVARLQAEVALQDVKREQKQQNVVQCI